jgi:hypothetical protein
MMAMMASGDKRYSVILMGISALEEVVVVYADAV